MKQICLLAMLLIGSQLQAQKPDFNLFLATRDTIVTIYENAVGNTAIAEIIEESSKDEWNFISILGQSSLRFYTQIYTSSNEIIYGWINKTDCAVYVNPHGTNWILYQRPDIQSNSTAFNAKIIGECDPYLYVLDYIVEAYKGGYPVWIKVGFMYKGAYYEGWVNEFCTDINHTCH